ncbi:MAG: DUF4159 domain-containing protein [Candidatus Eisenbacteria bacterium]|nr:DUF4159 domain-containing protein [Candidatus Eisenbacteria bacterium]
MTPWPHRLLASLAALALLAALHAPAAAAPSAAGGRSFGIARLKYGGGGDWYGNQTSLRNLFSALRHRTAIPVSGDDAAVVEPGSAGLFQFPFVFAAGHGNIKFTEAEGANLRRWIDSGGFLWVDDDFGLAPSFRREMKKLFPDAELVEIPFDHAIFREPYPFPAGLPKVHEHDGGPAKAFGIVRDGRLAVFFSFDSDLGDGLEDEDVHKDPPEKREAALRMAINIVQYALTH